VCQFRQESSRTDTQTLASSAREAWARIYLAEDREVARRIAIKVLDDRFASDEQLRERFKREALTAARLSGHPHVVTIFVGEWQGRPSSSWNTCRAGRSESGRGVSPSPLTPPLRGSRRPRRRSMTRTGSGSCIGT
jgi:serine/threonine protein kinase